MVSYLKEQDAYKSFLVSGHLASRSDVGEAEVKTQRIRDGFGGDTAHSTGWSFSSLGSYTVQRLIAGQKSQKSDMEGRVRGTVCTLAALMLDGRTTHANLFDTEIDRLDASRDLRCMRSMGREKLSI